MVSGVLDRRACRAPDEADGLADLRGEFELPEGIVYLDGTSLGPLTRSARSRGAAPGEVIVSDTTSLDIYKLLLAGLEARPGRWVVLTEEGNFPTDLSIAEALAQRSCGTRDPSCLRASATPKLLRGPISYIVC